MPFYVYAWLGSIVSALFVITAKLTSKYSISNPWLFNYFLFLCILIFMLPIALLNKAGLPSDWLSIILDAVFYTLFYITWVFATYSLDVTILIPLYNFRSVFTVFFGAIFFAEHFLPNQIIYIIIIIIAGIFTSMDEKFSIKAFFKKSIFIGLLSAFFLAIENALVKYALIKNDFWTMNLWVTILAFLFTTPTIFFFRKEFKKIKLIQFSPMLLMGFLETIAILFSNTAYAINISITSLIMNIPFSMIFAILLSIFIPKLLEKHTLKIYAIRLSSAAIMIWSAMQLTK